MKTSNAVMDAEALERVRQSNASTFNAITGNISRLVNGLKEYMGQLEEENELRTKYAELVTKKKTVVSSLKTQLDDVKLDQDRVYLATVEHIRKSEKLAEDAYLLGNDVRQTRKEIGEIEEETAKWLAKAAQLEEAAATEENSVHVVNNVISRAKQELVALEHEREAAFKGAQVSEREAKALQDQIETWVHRNDAFLAEISTDRVDVRKPRKIKY